MEVGLRVPGPAGPHLLGITRCGADVAGGEDDGLSCFCFELQKEFLVLFESKEHFAKVSLRALKTLS